MNHLKYLTILLLGLILSACGSGNNSLTGGGLVEGESNVTSIQLVSSAPTLQTDQTGTNFVTISAVVRDQNNNVVEGADLLFSATSGSVEEVDQGVTNAAGIGEALIKSFGNVRNRTITVRVQEPISGVSSTIDIEVVGTTLTISGPLAVAQGDPAPFILSLQDAQGVGIPGEVILVTSANGNTINNPAPVTGVSGEAQIVVTADGTAGDDTITVEALGITSAATLSVSDDIFAFTTPAAGSEAALDTNILLTVLWQQNGVNVPNGSLIEFTADRGGVNPAQAVTAGGLASVNIDSSFAGSSTITATGATIGGTPLANGPSTQLTIEFVADTPQNINVGAFPDLLIVGEQSTLTAVVRDALGNRVKGVNVDFNIFNDPSGGQLTVSSDVTDSQGVASTIYTAGQSTTEKDGVSITATVRNAVPAITSTANLTVSGRSINFVIGTGNDVFEISPSRFGVQYTVTATDVAGVPVAGQEIRLSVRNTNYTTGDLYIDTLLNRWVFDCREDCSTIGTPNGTPRYFCPDEDWEGNPPGNENGSLEPAEDDDGDGRLDNPNVTTIVAAVCDEVAGALDEASTQQSLLTDPAGSVEVCLVYPQEFNLWTDVRFSATVPIDGGTEVTQSRFFTLPALASDITNIQADPPGRISPYGAPPAAPAPGCVELLN